MIRLPALLSHRTLVTRRWARLSREGLTGLLLLAVCATFYLSALRPTQERRDRLQTSVTSLHDRMQATARNLRTNTDAPAEQLATYYKFFPAQASATTWLAKIYKAASDQNLQLEQGDYRPSRDPGGRLVRYQITLPVKGSYLQLRKFLAAVLADIPIASLDHISFERQKIGDDIIDAKIRLTLYLEQPS